MSDVMTDIIGTTGVAAIVVAYFALQTERLKHDDILYHLLNFVGASMILYSVIINWNLASFIIEVIWIAISVYGIYKVVRRRHGVGTKSGTEVRKDIDG